LTKKETLFILVQKCKGGGNGYLMGGQYEYVFVNSSDHYGFLPHHTNQCIDPVVEKGMTSLQRE
jgi:hypothetical protein